MNDNALAQKIFSGLGGCAAVFSGLASGGLIASFATAAGAGFAGIFQAKINAHREAIETIQGKLPAKKDELQGLQDNLTEVIQAETERCQNVAKKFEDLEKLMSERRGTPA